MCEKSVKLVQKLSDQLKQNAIERRNDADCLSINQARIEEQLKLTNKMHQVLVEQVESGFAGIHERLDRQRKNIDQNTTFRQRIMGVFFQNIFILAL